LATPHACLPNQLTELAFLRLIEESFWTRSIYTSHSMTFQEYSKTILFAIKMRHICLNKGLRNLLNDRKNSALSSANA
jgi:hypothetical protein